MNLDSAAAPAPSRLFLLATLFAASGTRSAAQEPSPAPPPGDDARHSMLRQAVLGLLPGGPDIPAARARHQCIELPVGPASDRLQGPAGDSLVSIRCEVVDYRRAGGTPPGSWYVARYRWTSVFTAEDSSRGPEARDTATEEEVVLFEAPGPDRARATWHARFETGEYAAWRSITPEIAPAGADGALLLSVTSCVNGTGGCGQDFLQRHPDGRWFPVWQVWLDQLPPGSYGRILHGVRIDPATLRGVAGFYGPLDPNCCPSEELLVTLALHGDSLVLRRQRVASAPKD